MCTVETSFIRHSCSNCLSDGQDWPVALSAVGDHRYYAPFPASSTKCCLTFECMKHFWRYPPLSKKLN